MRLSVGKDFTFLLFTTAAAEILKSPILLPLTPIPARARLISMVVACAPGASIPAGSISTRYNRLLYRGKHAGVPVSRISSIVSVACLG
jgi:hypothetical protein